MQGQRLSSLAAVNGDKPRVLLVVTLIVGLPLVAYFTTDRPATAFSVGWALFVLLVGCGVIIASGTLRGARADANRMLIAIVLLAASGLIVAYAINDWWMSAMASFTGLIALIITRSVGGEVPNAS